MDSEGNVELKDLHLLADLIYRQVMADFEEIHLSGNLKNTMQVTRDFGKSGEWFKVTIPAVRYDIDIYRERKVVVYTPEEGSYAEDVNRKGGFSGYHRGYVEKSIYRAIALWAKALNVTIETRERI